MKLRRTWPAIFIWVVFVLFDIVMVASSSYFSGLFPSGNLMVYVGIFSALSILVMSVLTFFLGKISDSLMVHDFVDNPAFRIIYSILMAAVIIGGVWYRVIILQGCTGSIVGKYSLYENAMVGGQNITPEFDLLSIVYSTVLRFILFFTGNIISVPFYFQIACFTIFVICSFFTVRMLLGRAAAFVSTVYVSFVSVFTYSFTGLELSTDSLFMAMFGIELFIVALFLKGAYKGIYYSEAWAIWYVLVGAVVGFMAYLDAGTIIMILPFLLATLWLYGRKPQKELARVLFVVAGAVIVFFVMIGQEAGFFFIPDRLSNWSSYFFHNLNTFSMFWAYTDHKILYLATVIGMSGVLVGYWKNRKVEKISPWLLSMLFISATVPFMGPTRMNTQVFVTVYYAFILGCVASLITLPSYEELDEGVIPDSEDAADAEEKTDEEIKKLAGSTDTGVSATVIPDSGVAKKEPETKTTEEKAESMPATTEATSEPEPATTDAESEPATTEAESEPATTDAESEPATTEAEPKPATAEAEPEPATTEPEQDSESVTKSVSEETETGSEPEEKKRYVPEGMVLPEDDEDVDLTPRMKMPEFKAPVGPDGKVEKLKVKGLKAAVAAAAITGILEEQEYTISHDEAPSTPEEPVFNDPKDDFDIAYKPGDDFDI